MSSLTINASVPSPLAVLPPHGEQGDISVASVHSEQGSVSAPPHSEQGDLSVIMQILRARSAAAALDNAADGSSLFGAALPGAARRQVFAAPVRAAAALANGTASDALRLLA